MAEEYTSKLKEFLNSGTRNAKITQVALCVLAVASMPILIFIAAAMGNAVQVFKKFNGSRRFDDQQIQRAMYHLRSKRLIEYTNTKEGKRFICITSKGRKHLRDFTIDLVQLKKPKKWDGKWRLVMFDIPIRFTKGREALRYHLKELNFLQFQKSAWINPYPCEEEIMFVADFYGVSAFIEILTVGKVMREEKLRKYFGLI